MKYKTSIISAFLSCVLVISCANNNTGTYYAAGKGENELKPFKQRRNYGAYLESPGKVIHGAGQDISGFNDYC